jgi:hypothetical protein
VDVAYNLKGFYIEDNHVVISCAGLVGVLAIGLDKYVAADFRLYVESDGQAVLLRYTGNGTEWQWQPVDADAKSFTLDTGAILAEADAAALGDAQSLRYQIQAASGTPFTSMVEPLSLNNTGYLFDIENH